MLQPQTEIAPFPRLKAVVVYAFDLGDFSVSQVREIAEYNNVHYLDDSLQEGGSLIFNGVLQQFVTGSESVALKLKDAFGISFTTCELYWHKKEIQSPTHAVCSGEVVIGFPRGKLQ